MVRWQGGRAGQELSYKAVLCVCHQEETHPSTGDGKERERWVFPPSLYFSVFTIFSNKCGSPLIRRNRNSKEEKL